MNTQHLKEVKILDMQCSMPEVELYTPGLHVFDTLKKNIKKVIKEYLL